MRKFIMSEETGGANENETHLLSWGSNAKLKFTPEKKLKACSNSDAGRW